MEIEPQDETGLHNMVLCHLQLKDYGKAMEGIRRMLSFWPKKPELHTLMAQACFAQGDTTAAMGSIDRALELNPYEGQAWSMRAMVYANRGEYKNAEDALDKTIQQKPREADNYITVPWQGITSAIFAAQWPTTIRQSNWIPPIISGISTVACSVHRLGTTTVR